jgi:putative ATP-dependent endonuclease of OLD family
MSILIDKVRIKNFRSLKDIEVNLQPVTLLVGANNSGKTTFLQALNIALGVSKIPLTKDDLFIDSDGNQTDNKIIIDVRIIPTDDENTRVDTFEQPWLGILGSDANKQEGYFAFRTEITFLNNGDKYQSRCFFLENWESPTPQEGDILTSSVKKYILLYFLDAQRDLEQDTRLRSSYFGRLAVQLEKDYGEEQLETIKDLVRQLNSETIDNSSVLTHLKGELSKLNKTTNTTGEGVSLTPFPMKVRDLHKGMKVNFQDNGSDIFSLEYHGMGTRSWASILSFSAFIAWETKQREEDNEGYFPILALEEPEAHLHPNAQRTLYQQLKKIDGQKIISTHSPYIVGQADLEQYIFFTKEEDFVTTSIIEDLDEMKDHERQSLSRFVIDLRGEILFSRLVVLAEGETEERFLNILAKRYFDDFYSLSINIIGCGGSNYKYFIKILQASNIPFLVFSDYDNTETRTKVNRQLRDCGLDPNNCDELIDLGKDIEDYLIDEEYENELREAANQFIPIWFSRESMQNIQRNNILTTEGLRVFLKKYKTKLASIYGETLVNLNNGRSFPPRINDLFTKISTKLNITEDETGTI